MEEFKYLGNMLTKAGTSDREVRGRVESGWRSWKKMTGVLCDKKALTRVKGKIYSIVVRPAVLYAVEVVPLSAKQERQLEVVEMKMCRWVDQERLSEE